MRAWLNSFVISVFLLAPLGASPDRIFSEDLYREALERFQADDLKKAHGLLKALDAKYPDHPVVLNNLGVVSGKLGKFQLAEGFFKRVIELNREVAISYHNLQKIYNRRAVETYRQALVLNSNPLPLPDFKFIMSSAPSELVAEVAATEQILRDERVKKPMVEDPQRADAPVLGEEEEIIRFVTGWAKAWSERDSDAYFLYYADGYQPRPGITNAKWKKGRMNRLRSPKFISVKMSEPRIKENDDGYDVVFVQDYESNLLRSVVIKKLSLQKVGPGWKIVKERVVERQ